MIYHILADIVVAIHLLYVGYVVFGELLIIAGIPLRWRWIRNFWFRITHLLMIVIVALEALLRFECPLTTWEYDLIVASGVEAENRSFVGRLMNQLLFFDCPDESWIWKWVYGGVAAIILLTFVLAPPRLPARWSKPIAMQQGGSHLP